MSRLGMSLLPEVAKEEADGEWRDFSRTWVEGQSI